MIYQPYHPHRPPGGGQRVVCLTTATSQRVILKTFNEQFAAAQLIQAQLFLGADRAEAFAAQRTLEIRQEAVGEPNVKWSTPDSEIKMRKHA